MGEERRGGQQRIDERARRRRIIGRDDDERAARKPEKSRRDTVSLARSSPHSLSTSLFLFLSRTRPRANTNSTNSVGPVACTREKGAARCRHSRRQAGFVGSRIGERERERRGGKAAESLIGNVARRPGRRRRGLAIPTTTSGDRVRGEVVRRAEFNRGAEADTRWPLTSTCTGREPRGASSRSLRELSRGCRHLAARDRSAAASRKDKIETRGLFNNIHIKLHLFYIILWQYVL